MRAAALLLVASAGLAGCGGDPTTDAPADPCARDRRPVVAGSVCVASVSGRLVDPSGAPLASRLATFCGGETCYYGRTRDDGGFTTAVGARLLTDEYVVFAHGAPTHANLLVELAAERRGPDVRLPAPVLLPRLPDEGPALPPDDGPGGEVSSGGLTLRVPPGTRVSLDIEDVARGDAGRMLRVARVEGAQLPPFARDAGAVFALATAPFDASFSRPVGASIDGAAGLSPGQRVELYDQETSFLGDTTGTGRARLVARGAVSGDGARILLDADAGVTRLTWLAVRGLLDSQPIQHTLTLTNPTSAHGASPSCAT